MLNNKLHTKRSIILNPWYPELLVYWNSYPVSSRNRICWLITLAAFIKNKLVLLFVVVSYKDFSKKDAFWIDKLANDISKLIAQNVSSMCLLIRTMWSLQQRFSCSIYITLWTLCMYSRSLKKPVWQRITIVRGVGKLSI